MNDWDRNNLNFLLNADARTMKQWHQHATPDDYTYALELMQSAVTELLIQELDVIDHEAEENCSDAVAVLNQFRL